MVISGREGYQKKSRLRGDSLPDSTLAIDLPP
jgi:hypothetical protein